MLKPMKQLSPCFSISCLHFLLIKQSNDCGYKVEKHSIKSERLNLHPDNLSKTTDIHYFNIGEEDHYSGCFWNSRIFYIWVSDLSVFIAFISVAGEIFFWFRISNYGSFVSIESSPLLRTETSASAPEVKGTWWLLAKDNRTASLLISLEFIPLMSRTSPGLLVFVFWALLQPWGWLWPRNWSF